MKMNLKYLKERCADWLGMHERLYWWLVVAVAVVCFVTITMVGCLKLERAEAAENPNYPPTVVNYKDRLDISVPDIRTLDWSLYEEYFLVNYGLEGGVNIAEHIIREHKYMIVVINPYYASGDTYEISKYWYLFTNEPVQYVDYGKHWLLADWYTDIFIEVEDGSVSLIMGYGKNDWSYDGVGEHKIPFVIKSNNNSQDVLGSTYDYRGDLGIDRGYQHSNMTYPKFTPSQNYNENAPYVSFDSLNIICPLATETYDLKFYELKAPERFHMSNSVWQYNGRIVNPMDLLCDSYLLKVHFTIELPSAFHIKQWKTLHGIEYIDDGLLKWSTVCAQWFADMSGRETYEFDIDIPLTVQSDGTFTYYFTYEDIYMYLCYFNEDFRSLWFTNETDPKIYDWEYLMACMHVEETSALLFSMSGSNKYYGRTIVNNYSPTVLNRAVTFEYKFDVYNTSDDEISSEIESAIQKGYDEALNDAKADVDALSGQLGQVNGQLESMYSVNTALSGNLTGSDLWTGFSGLITGFASMGPAVYSLAVLSGQVFGFMPMQVSGVITFTLLGLCIIALYKAIRG